jgi:lysophospholipase L1-like esterase/chitodextrinase
MIIVAARARRALAGLVGFCAALGGVPLAAFNMARSLSVVLTMVTMAPMAIVAVHAREARDEAPPAGPLSFPLTMPAALDGVAVMPLGDSLTYGFISANSPNNDDGGYRRYLWEKLLANGITNVNFVGSLATGIAGIDRDHEGHGGMRVDEIDAAAAGWLANAPPDIILLQSGTNDLQQGSTPALVLSRLAHLLDSLHALRPSARILLANLSGPRANPDPLFATVTPQNVADVNNGIPSLVSTRVALGWNIALVDVFGSAGFDRSSTSSDYSDDGMHMSLAGYSKFANLWFEALYPGGADTTAPSPPTGLSAATISSSQINLTWTASTDNVGVTSYQIYRNGVSIATTGGTTYQSTGLAASTAYAYTVAAYDAANNQSAQSSPAGATTSSAPRLTSFQSNVAFPVSWNVPITFTATAAGGTGLQYKFLMYTAASGWAVGQDFSSSRTFMWYPPQGQNAVQVWIRDTGSAAFYEDWMSTGLFSVVVSPPKLTGIGANVALPAAPTTTITWTASASGGTGVVEYKFLHYNLAANAWSVLRDWSGSHQASWVPGVSNSGWHALQVWVRTAGSTVAWEDWRATDYFLVTAPTAVNLTPNRALSGLKVGDLVTWTANVSGGAGPWEYQFLTFDGTSWKLLQPYSTQNTFSWFPPAETCALQVWVRAAGSLAYWEQYQSSGYFSVSR